MNEQDDFIRTQPEVDGQSTNTSPLMPSPETATVPNAQGAALYRERNRTLIAAAALIGALMFVGGTGYAYTAGYISLPFVSDRAPYTPDTLIENIIANTSRVESAAFDVSASFSITARDADMIPLSDELRVDNEFRGELDALWREIVMEIPHNTSVSAQMQGAFALIDDAIGTFQSTFVAAVESPDFNAYVDFDVLLSADDLYIRANRMPPTEYFDISSVRGRWVHFSQSAQQLLGIDESWRMIRYESASAEETYEQSRQFWNLVATHDFLLVDTPRREQQDGEDVFVYQTRINPETADDFVRSALSYFSEEYDDVTSAEIEEAYAELKPYLSAAHIEHLNRTFTYEIIVAADGTPRGGNLTMRFLVPENGSGTDADQQINITFSFTTHSINRPQNISAPLESIPYEEAFQLMLDGDL